MALVSRVVVPGVPHHIIQRGYVRTKTFFCDTDYRVYRSLISTYCMQYGVEVWAYCFMPNNIQFIAVPGREDSIRRAFGEAHQRYSRHINLVKNWRGNLWRGRFASYPLGEDYLAAASWYVEMNPVRAGLSDSAVDYPWSSARAHCKGRDDELVRVGPMLELVRDWRSLLLREIRQAEMDRFLLHEKTGRPLGCDAFVEDIGNRLERILRMQKPGRKRKDA